MRVFDQGAFVRVTVSEPEVDRFNRKWPGSTLDGPYSFTFDKSNGDLVDMAGKGDGSEHVALSTDAQNYAAKRLKLESLKR